MTTIRIIRPAYITWLPLSICLVLLMAVPARCIDIYVDAAAGQRPISPYIYGKNNALSDNPKHSLSDSDWAFLEDAGVRFLRENGGNNATKYNWKLKLSSHPDWYNNVYRHDWDYAARSLQDNLPGVQGMWSFQLIGKAAATSAYNFNDWGYNRSQWWEGVRNNWAGGGGPNAGEGDPNLYLVDWSASDTVGILDHWFDPQHGLGLDPCDIRYWSMDNEPEIWSGTHDDVYAQQPSAEAFLQKYFAVAKEARARFPDIKLCGPVPANEWQWYNWDNDTLQDGDTRYPWLEYFIKRIGEEEQASGIRLLDVLDLHFYPGETDPADIVQLHRVWFDENYDYPGANGVKRLGRWGWDNSIRQEYIFARCRAWLDTYLGPDHGVTLGVTEMGIQGSNPNVTAVWYASTLGVFADEGVEVFTPWTWKPGMWEVLHLFSRYGRAVRVACTSDNEETVSAYASLNTAQDAMTVICVNRSLDQSREVRLILDHFHVADGLYDTRQLNDLPAGETFYAHEHNALQAGAVTVQDQVATLTLPPLSVTAVLLSGQLDSVPEDLATDTIQP